MEQDRDKINRIYDAIYKIDKLYESWAKKHKVSYNRMLIFYYLMEDEQMTQMDLSEEIEIPKQTVNNIVQALVESGQAELKMSSNNKKEKFVVLTEMGREYGAELISPLYNIEKRIVGAIDDNEMNQLVNTLTKYSDIFEEEMNEL